MLVFSGWTSTGVSVSVPALSEVPVTAPLFSLLFSVPESSPDKSFDCELSEFELSLFWSSVKSEGT